MIVLLVHCNSVSFKPKITFYFNICNSYEEQAAVARGRARVAGRAVALSHINTYTNSYVYDTYTFVHATVNKHTYN